MVNWFIDTIFAPIFALLCLLMFVLSGGNATWINPGE